MSDSGTGMQRIKDVANGKSVTQIGLGGTTAAAVSYLMVVLLNPLQDRVDEMIGSQTDLQIKVGRLEGRLENLQFRIERLENQRMMFDLQKDTIREASNGRKKKGGCDGKRRNIGKTQKASAGDRSREAASGA